jgi:hypothetical protein
MTTRTHYHDANTTFAAESHTHDEDDLSLTDVTTNNSSASKHGFLPKLSGSSSDVLKGDGTWGSGGSGAPTNATYIVQTAHADLSAEQALSSLSTGLVKVTNGTGVLSTATAGTDYSAASHTHALSDITGDGALAAKDTVATADIDDDAVTYAKMQNVSATDKLLGRSTAGAGNVEEIACTAAGRALLDDASAADQRTTLGAAATSHTHTTADVTDYDTGSITAADGSGAGLTLDVSGEYTQIGQQVFGTVRVLYPATADTSDSQINFSGIPNSGNSIHSRAGAVIALTDSTDAKIALLLENTPNVRIYTAAIAARVTNAQLSGKQLLINFNYTA